jgi:molecular chaperone GrpE
MMSHENDTDKNMEDQEAPKAETDTAQANTSDADTINAETEAASAPDEQPSEQPAPEEHKEEPEEIDPEQQIADLNEKMLRLAAELENTRRRAERDKSDALRYGVTGFARDMVSVGDNLTRALNAIEETDREGLSDNMVNLLEGVGATQRDLMAALQRNGLKPIAPEGEKFDPNFHEAMYEAPGTGRDSGTIIEVVEIGYMIGERLLRPAKVGVAKDG